MKKRNVLVALLSVAMVAVLLFSAVPVSAATQSNGTKQVTIKVWTKGNWWIPGSESITLSQTKGTRSLKNPLTGKVKERSCYGTWNIVAKANDGSHTVKATLSGGSVKVKLKPDKAYTITVSWNQDKDTLDTVSYGSFKKYPTWRVSGTYKVEKYY